LAITNFERIGKMLDLIRQGLAPFVERELKAHYQQKWFEQAKASMEGQQAMLMGIEKENRMDAAALLLVMWNLWNEVFKKTLGHPERSIVSELREVRNRWAHQTPFSSDDAYRAMDSAGRLLTAVSAPEADEVEKIKMELLRVRFDEQVRSEKRRQAGAAVESQVTGALKPWREVVLPHEDVAKGRYQQAEFAADLWQVHLGEGTEEYRNPAEFFRRTFLTESLKQLLEGAVKRVSGAGGDPVVQLQTNFGGGKTHSMLALYHLFSGANPSDLAGVEALMAEAGVQVLPKVRRVVLVGNKISPGNPIVKADGTVVRTLWGELAYQLGGKKAFEKIRLDDERATSPGDKLRELFNEYGPVLVLIDEWVAYARQLHDQGDLPAGTFETHFTFSQALTESAKGAKHCLLVISLPASDASGSPHIQADDVEVGGERGRAALDRLRNAIGRVEASWRPASAEEGFEIVRRRLFQPLVEQGQFVARDTVAKAFSNLYNSQKQEFPPESGEMDYERRLKAAYPIHPEVFDRLYGDWSTLVKFQRTRGVLRLMAAVIHTLWQRGDKNPLIMPCHIPIDDPRVQFELTRYLSDNWAPVLERDVDGAHSLPLKIDDEISTLGKYSACRRVARTVYLGSAPTAGAANRGLEDRRIKLGCVMPGESTSVFGDALRRLSATATFLYQDGARYWYSTQPTVTKMADDRAEQLKSNSDAVAREVERRLKENLQKRGEFLRVHAHPQTSQDVPDEMEARLVVLGTDRPYSKEPGSPAELAAKEIFEKRGNAPRIYRNTLIFLAVDKSRLQDLDEATRKYLAWVSIVEEQVQLNLTPHQVKQAESARVSQDASVSARLPEAYQWMLVPTQEKPDSSVLFTAVRVTGQDALAVRATNKLRNDGRLLCAFGGSVLRKVMDSVPLWKEGNHVEIKQLEEDFARYLYLERLKSPELVLAAVKDGMSQLSWVQDGFAYADSFDEKAGRYRGLRLGGVPPNFTVNPTGVLVKPEIALKQAQAETEEIKKAGQVTSIVAGGTASATAVLKPGAPPAAMGDHRPKRFHGSVILDSARVGRDAGVIAENIVSHLVALVGAEVKVTLEIEAKIPNGAPDHVVRTVTENSRTLKFTDQGFESV